MNNGAASVRADRATLETIVERAFGTGARLEAWSAAPIAYRTINLITKDLQRIELVARLPDGSQARRSVVEKTMRRRAPDEGPERARFAPASDPAHWNYWRREYDVYGSPLPASLPAGLRAPACYARALHGEDEATIWTEFVDGVPAAAWSDDAFYAAARAFGRWQGESFRDPASLPDAPWLCRSFLRDWTFGDPATLEAACDSERWSNPLVRRHLDPRRIDGARALARNHAAMLAAAETSPPVPSHNDLWSTNLFACGDETVAIDWAMAGISSIAEDVANLVFDSVWMFDVPATRLRDVERAVTAGYDAGLAAANAGIDAARAGRAFARISALRFGSLATNLLRTAANPQTREALAERYARPFEEVLAARAAVVSRCLEFAALSSLDAF